MVFVYNGIHLTPFWGKIHILQLYALYLATSIVGVLEVKNEKNN